MAITQVTGREIKDGSIQRIDLNTTSTGQAVIRKIIPGTNINIISTGIDAGTGDVTINVTSTGISEAPIDGQAYNRKDANWVATSTGTYFPEAPIDGQIYGRKDANWTITSTGISEAPADGNQYSRKDLDWVITSTGVSFPEAPIDGNQYSRKDADWILTSSGINDAPLDGQTYGRNNAEWVITSTGTAFDNIITATLYIKDVVETSNMNTDNYYLGDELGLPVVDESGNIVTM
jgi:hypothetical protein